MSKQTVEKLLSVLEQVAEIIIPNNECFCLPGEYSCLNCSIRLAIKEGRNFLGKPDEVPKQQTEQQQFVSHSDPIFTVTPEDLKKFFPD